MAIIKRSPYTFTVEQDAMRLTIGTDVFESGSIEWPVYEVDGKYYLQEKFDLNVPSGCDVIKITVDTFRGTQVSKVIITDTDNNLKIYDNTLSTVPLYIRLGVSQNAVYKLKTEDMTMINYNNGALRFEWSHAINKDTIDIEDYKDDDE